jgi:simple sugar transport system ATP-binding protein
MVGRDIGAPLVRMEQRTGAPLLQVRDLWLCGSGSHPLLANISFDVRAGEILAVAGVDGNSQLELVETIAGMRLPTRGAIRLAAEDVTRHSVRARTRCGLSFVPPDRAQTSLVADMTVAENLALRDVDHPPFSRRSLVSRAGLRKAAARLIEQYSIRAPGGGTRARQLSGGNQQKVVVAREIDRAPKVFVAFQATWGLDPGATRFVLEQMLALRARGAAVLYVSTELEELLAIGDRLCVMFQGRMSQPVPREAADLDQIGLLMAGAAPIAIDTAA